MDPDFYRVPIWLPLDSLPSEICYDFKFNDIKSLVVMDLEDHNLKRVALGMTTVDKLPEHEIMLEVDTQYKYLVNGKKYNEMKKEFENINK